MNNNDFSDLFESHKHHVAVGELVVGVDINGDEVEGVVVGRPGGGVVGYTLDNGAIIDSDDIAEIPNYPFQPKQTCADW